MLSLVLAMTLLARGNLVPSGLPVEDRWGPMPQLPVEVELLSPPPGQMYVEDLWRVRLTNTSTETFSVYLFVTIEEVSRGLLMDATTSVFILPPGTMVLSSVELSPISTEFYDSGFESSVGRMGNFPDGLYTVTIYVYEEGGGLLGSGGMTQEVRNHTAPALQFPVDGETVSQPLPLFSWLPSVPSGDISYDLRIVRVLEGQSPQSAVSANPAWFHQEGIEDSQLAYPVIADGLDCGQTYAWQVEGFYQGVSVGASDVWTFTYDSSEILAEEGSAVWSFETGGRVYCSPAIAPDGSIVCGSDDGSVYSLDRSGSEQWRYSPGGRVFAVMTQPDGRIFASGDFGVLCLDASGFPVWHNPLDGRVAACPLMLPSGALLAGSVEGVLYALDGSTGEIEDSLGNEDGIYLPPVADSTGTLYFACDDGLLRSVEYVQESGFTENWSFRAEDGIAGGPVVFAGRVYAAAGREVFCLDMEGRQVWRSRLPSEVYTGPVIAAGGIVYTGTGSGNVYALGHDTGERTGIVPAGAVVTSTPALNVTGALVFGCEDGRVHCYSPSGFLLWDFQTGDQVRSSPAIGMDGTVYFGSDDHMIYAVKGSGAGPMLDGWPQYCLDASRNGSLAPKTGSM